MAIFDSAVRDDPNQGDPVDFFISYTGKDLRWAEWIAWTLEEAGHTVLFQAWDSLPGDNIMQFMMDANARAQATVAVFSPNYLRSPFAMEEGFARWAEDLRQDTRRFQLVLVAPFGKGDPSPSLLLNRVHTDITEKSEEEARQKVLKMAGVALGRTERLKPEGRTAFPGAAGHAATADATGSARVRPAFPNSTARPEVRHLPRGRNPYFTGRGDILLRLWRNLNRAGANTVINQVVQGLGGIGKTEIATHFAHAHLADYQALWWVDAETADSRAAGLMAFAKALGMDGGDEEQTSAALKRWMEDNHGWLLILDNVPHPEDIRGLLPPLCAGHVVITSRDAGDWGRVQPLVVDVLDLDSAVRFLLERAGQDDRDGAERLAVELGCLPLALEQAAAYIGRGHTFDHYLELFESNRQKLLGMTRHLPEGYPAPAAATWNASMAAVEAESPAARDLLRLLAFLDPDEIPTAMLTEGAQALPEPLAAVAADPFARDEALAILARYSLVRIEKGLISLHRLVQDVTRFCLGEAGSEGFNAWAQAAFDLMEAVFAVDDDDPETWQGGDPKVNHALAAAGHAQAGGTEPGRVAAVFNYAGQYQGKHALYHAALENHARALALAEETFGPEHEAVATYANNLGSLLQDQGDLPGARRRFEQALAIDRDAFGDNHPEVAIRATNLGLLLIQLGEPKEARRLLQQAYDTFLHFLGPDHPNTAIPKAALDDLGPPP